MRSTARAATARAPALLAVASLALVAAACNAIFGIEPPDPSSSSTSSSASSGAASSSTSSGGGGSPGGVVRIEAGTYTFQDYGAQTMTQATITRAFELDRVEATVDRFQKFVAAGLPAPCSSGTCSLEPSGPYASVMIWDATWNQYLSTATYAGTNCNPSPAMSVGPTYPTGNARFPVTCLNWYQAAAFCFFEQKRLPTETEWRFAATSRGTTMDYPWGSEPPGPSCDHAIFSVSLGANDCHFPVAVGSTPKGQTAQGLFDMAGSVYEWGWDWDAPYPASPTTDYAGGDGMITDAGNQPGRETLGGSYAWDDSSLHVWSRNNTTPTEAFNDVGVRCARTAP